MSGQIELEAKKIAKRTEALRPCPRHRHVLLRGAPEAIAAAYFKTGSEPALRKALDDVIGRADLACQQCQVGRG